MGFRREPRTIPEKLAALEEQLRRLTRQVVVAGSGVTSGGLPSDIFVEPGDLMVGTGVDRVTRLAPGDPGEVLTSEVGGLAWEVDQGADALMLVALMDEG